jgi:hypothetical protein
MHPVMNSRGGAGNRGSAKQRNINNDKKGQARSEVRLLEEFHVTYAFLGLIGAVGAWMAWRRNPAYSARSTLRMIGLSAVAVALMFCLVFAAADFSTRQPAPVAITVMALVVVFGTLMMILIVHRASTPKAARLTTSLPPAATVVHVHRRRAYHWFKIAAAAVLVSAIAAAIIPGSAKFVPLIGGALVLGMGAIMLPVMYISARTLDLSLSSVQCDPWVHWRYTAGQWLEWSDTQVARLAAAPPAATFKVAVHRLVWPFAIVAVGVIGFSPGTLLERVLYVVGVFAVILLAVWRSATENRRAPGKLRIKLRQAPREAYFGHDGMYCDGEYAVWLSTDVYLLSAVVDQRPPRSLKFEFEKVIFNPYNATQRFTIWRSVLIPDGAEEDLRRLQRELAARCATAKILLV